jgi:putative nucleotidyltransferase with HDIG domain
MSWAHLAGRFLRAHRPGGPPARDRAWVASVLTPEELGLWQRLPGHDRRHTVEVARRVEATLDGTAYGGDDRWVACGLLHDVGKLAAGLGIYGRVVATLAAKAGWPALGRRIHLYLRHGQVGADMIREAGGREEAAAWAAVHHRRPEWAGSNLPSPVIEALAAADPD